MTKQQVILPLQLRMPGIRLEVCSRFDREGNVARGPCAHRRGRRRPRPAPPALFALLLLLLGRRRRRCRTACPCPCAGAASAPAAARAPAPGLIESTTSPKKCHRHGCGRAARSVHEIAVVESDDVASSLSEAAARGQASTGGAGGSTSSSTTPRRAPRRWPRRWPSAPRRSRVALSTVASARREAAGRPGCRPSSCALSKGSGSRTAFPDLNGLLQAAHEK